jgi:hypothetical protein
MTETIDQLIQARFDRVASTPAEGDWGDVLARAEKAGRGRVPIRIALAAAVATIAATATAVAFGWPQTVVDFFKAPPAPQSVNAFFGAYNLAIPGGVSPATKLGHAREIMTATFDANHLTPTQPTLHTLYVAPREDGGFCYLWTDFGGSCADPEDAAKATTHPAARALGLEWLENDYAGFVTGWVRTDAQTLEADFADGTTASIPLTWVSPPISAGFFAYVVPDAHLTRADALTSVVALDANGAAVDKRTFALTKPLDEDVMQTLPDGTKISLPRRAQAAHAREVVSLRANGAHVWLWVMPRTGGGTCYLYGTGGGGGHGCISPHWLARLPAVNGGDVNGIYFAQVKPDVAAVELRYRNGDSERFTPTDGFVLHQMQHDTGLVAAIGLDRSGNAVYTQREQPWKKVFQP